MARRSVPRRGEAGTAVVVVACLIGALAATVHGDTSAPRRGDAKVYRFLGDTKRLPKLDAGDAERTFRLVHWQPLPRRADDPALGESKPRLQILDATCDADLVVFARIETAVPFQHPNGRWVVTAHDLAVSRVVRAKAPKTPSTERLRYVHPSGELPVGGRTVRTTVDRFPPLASDEEALFFLIRIEGGAYRTSLLLPPMALRGGILDPLGTGPPATAREPAAGLAAREAARAAAGAVCRPAPVDPAPVDPWRSRDSGRLPPLSGPAPP